MYNTVEAPKVTANFGFTRLLRILLLFFVLIGVTTAQAQPTFTKAFVPGTIGPGSISTLRFDITNGAGMPVSNLAFTDNLPAGVTIAAPSSAISTCGATATLTAPDGGGTITFSGGDVAAVGSCSIMVNVTAAVAATYTNTSGDLTSDAGNSGTATDDLTVAANRPGFSKSFSPGSISIGGRSTLTFNIDNSANGSFAASIAFIDNLPTGVVVASPSNAVTDCTGAILNATSGSSVISIPGSGFLLAGATCTVTVDVIGAAVGVHDNVSGELTSSPGGPAVSSGKATDTLTVSAGAINFSKSFTDDPVNPGDTVTLEFTLINTDRNSTATNIAFTDDLDVTLSGLVATGLPVSNVCGTGSILSGTSLLSLTGGNLAADGGTCTFSVTLQVPAGATAGAYPNTTSSLTADINGSMVTSDPATETLFVNDAPSLTKTFLTDPLGAGDTVSVEFTVSNSSTTSAATDITFQDNISAFSSGATVSALPAPGFCGAGSIMFPNTVSGDLYIVMSGGNLAASDSCTFSVDLLIPAGTPGGTYTNTTDQISATVDGTTQVGGSASDTLTIVSAPTLTKEFTDDPVLPGGTVTLEFTISHDIFAPADATGIMFTDDLTAALSGLAATGLPMNDVCGTGSLISGTTDLTFTGGTLTPGASCTFSVTLQVPASALPGVYLNTTSSVVATVSGVTTTRNGAQDNLIISGLMLTKEFTDDPVIPGDTATLEFTLDNTVSTVNATGIFFTDILSSTLSGLVATGLPMNNICGAGSSITGTSFLIFTGGSLTAGTSCTFSLTLQVPASAADGVYNNNTSNLIATIGATPTVLEPAVDSLTVSSDLLSLSKDFTDDPVSPGDTVTLEFSLTNQADSQATNITFTDDLDAVLSGLAAVAPLPMAPCGAGSSLSGSGVLTLSNGTLAAMGTCTFSVTVQVPGPAATGTFTNTTSTVTGTVSMLNVNGAAASADLDILSLSLEKEFIDTFDGMTNSAAIGGTVILRFTITNLDGSNGASSLSFSDDLDAVISGLVATGLPASDVCGSGSQITGTSLLTFSGGDLLPGGSCTFDVTLNIPGTATAGTFTNTSSDLFISGIPVANPASAELLIEPLPTFMKSFAPDSIGIGATSTLNFVIDNTSSVLDADMLAFADNLPAGVVVANPPDAMTNCSGTLTAMAGSGVISFSGGSVGVTSMCLLQVNVVGNSVGDLVNTTGDLTSTLGNSGTATDTLTVNPQPGFSKSFAPDTIAMGNVSTLTFAIDNTASTVDATALDFTDNLPAAVVIATPANATTNCTGGTLTAVDGTGVITYTGGTVSMAATCAVSVDVTSSTIGSHVNTSGSLTSSLGDSSTAMATLVVDPPSSFSKSFAPADIAINGTSTLTFTIDNTTSSLAATGLDFTDNLPTSVIVATSPNSSTTCTGGTLTAVAGSSVIAYTGGTVSAMSGCTVQVDVTGSAAGSHVNTSGDLTSILGNGGTATDTLIVVPPPGFSKSFVPDPIAIGGISTLTFTIDNSTSSLAAMSLDFTDMFPAGVEVANPPNASSTCIAGMGDAAAGNTSFSYSGGTVAASSTCTISVDVTAASAGTFNNTSGDLTSSLGNSGTASGSLLVNPAQAFSKNFAPDSIATDEISTLTFTIDNSGSSEAATGLDFTDTLPTNVVVATPANATTDCTGGTLTAVAGSSDISYAGGTVAAMSSCTVAVDVSSSLAGVYDNVSGPLNSSLGSSAAAMDTLTVTAVPGFSKTFTPGIMLPDGISILTLVIDNTNSSLDVTSLALVDNLPTEVQVATPANSSTTCNGGTLTATAGASTLSYSGGTVTALSTCEITVDVTSATDGVYDNTTDELTSDAGTSGTASATLTVTSAVELTKTFTDSPIQAGGAVTLEFTLSNTSTTEAASNITFSDDLDAALSGLAASGLPAADVCGAGSQLSGSSVITLSGASLATDASCTFSVSVQVPLGTANGTYTNTTSQVSAELAGETLITDPASADLIIAGFVFTKTFTDDPIAAGGVVNLEFTINNPDPVNAVTDLAFSDDLEAVLTGLEAINVPQNDICGAGSALTGTSVVALSGGNLSPGGTCTFSVNVQVPDDAAAGVYTNTAGPLSATIAAAGTGGFITANIGEVTSDDMHIVDLPRLSKVFGSANAVAGGTVDLDFSITNPSTTFTATGISFTDDLDAVLTGLQATGLPQSDICGPGSQINGTSVLTFSGGTLAPGETCQFSITLAIPNTAAGIFTNITSPITATVDGATLQGAAGTEATAEVEIFFNVPGMGVWMIFLLMSILSLLALAMLGARRQ